jgi:hypothetical protein
MRATASVWRRPESSVVTIGMAMDIASRDERGRPLQYNDTTNTALCAIIGLSPSTSPRYSITPSSRKLRCDGGRCEFLQLTRDKAIGGGVNDTIIIEFCLTAVSVAFSPSLRSPLGTFRLSAILST